MGAIVFVGIPNITQLLEGLKIKTFKRIAMSQLIAFQLLERMRFITTILTLFLMSRYFWFVENRMTKIWCMSLLLMEDWIVWLKLDLKLITIFRITFLKVSCPFIYSAVSYILFDISYLLLLFQKTCNSSKLGLYCLTMARNKICYFSLIKYMVVTGGKNQFRAASIPAVDIDACGNVGYFFAAFAINILVSSAKAEH